MKRSPVNNRMKAAGLAIPAGTRRATTRRILTAALQVFSREGLAATTREIARIARVNEATLFRQFESKERLLTAVTAEVVRLEAEALARIDLAHFDLRRDLTRLAKAYAEATGKHEAFIRTMMARPVDPKLSQQVMREVIEPLRVKFVDYLIEGQRRGLVRKINLGAAVDAFTGMIFASSLRSSIYRPGYTRKVFLYTCVELFLNGVCVKGSTGLK